MNSSELQKQITETQSRARLAATRAADASLNVDDKLQAQSHLSDLRALETRLQSQLSEAQQREGADQKKKVDKALDAEMSELIETKTRLRAEINKVVLGLTPQFLEACDGVVTRSQEVAETIRRYEDAYFERHNDYPKPNDPINKQPPAVSDEGYAEVSLSISLLHNSRSGYGNTVRDVYDALGFVSSALGPKR